MSGHGLSMGKYGQPLFVCLRLLPLPYDMDVVFFRRSIPFVHLNMWLNVVLLGPPIMMSISLVVPVGT